MDRLSSLEAEFLNVEDGINHMHIGGVSIFEGPAPADGEIERTMAARIHTVPRYRQRVRSVPLELGRQVWVDDPHFNLRYHIRHTALAAPGDDAALVRLVGRLMSQPLDRGRPLWEAWIVEGLADGRWAAIWKVHHCMVDGVGGVGLLAVALDTERDTVRPEPPTWTPAAEPTATAKVIDAWLGATGDFWGAVARTPGWVRHPAGTAQRAGANVAGLARLGRHLVPTPSLSIEGPIGPHRSWAHASTDLDPVKRVGKDLGGKVNDVVLTAITRGYRDLLLAHGDDLERAVVRTVVPVSLRPAGDAAVDNQVSTLLLELPVAIDHPLERFDAVRRAMDDLKRSHQSEAAAMLTNAAGLVPPMLMGTATRLAARTLQGRPQRSITTVTTNVPGPQLPLYCVGREMLSYLPYVPIAEGVRVGTAIMSYNGKVAFGITGDYDTADDVDVLARGILAGIDELTALT
jgi:diacylglycerol O-acyltransferase